MIDRPQIVEEKHLTYLDRLRGSGITNMLGAGEYLEKTFYLPAKDARTILVYWMKSFRERHPVKTISLGDILDCM